MSLKFFADHCVSKLYDKHKNMKKIDIQKRDEEIYILRQKGKAFKHIASLYNISSTRAQQLYAREKDKRENFEQWPPLKKVLSNRTQKALITYFGNENILNAPEKIAELGRIELSRIRNLGRKSITELVIALHGLGYIEYDDDLLKYYLKK